MFRRVSKKKRMNVSRNGTNCTRREVLLALASMPMVPRKRALASEASFPTVTDRVYMEFGVCPSLLRNDRKLGDRSALCGNEEAKKLGRIVFGLYGERAPRTVQNFVSMISEKRYGKGYLGTTVAKIKPGEYVLLGKQGSSKFGKVEDPNVLDNPETVSVDAFRLNHLRPGTLSLAIGANDDDAKTKSSRGYRNVEFLITTGPGPALQLDGQNLVFGRVLEGMPVIADIVNVPRNVPSESTRRFNALAGLLGDTRATGARNAWDAPLQSIVVLDCGVLPVVP